MKTEDLYPPGFEAEGNNLSIDFDGVIHTFDKGYFDGTCYGAPIPGAIDAIRLLSSKYRIVIFTAKAKPSRPLVNGKTGVQLVEEWLKKYGILDCVAEITAEKPRSFLYIDDNAYRFTSWPDTIKYMENEFENKGK
jgi:hypothetical protein